MSQSTPFGEDDQEASFSVKHIVKATYLSTDSCQFQKGLEGTTEHNWLILMVINHNLSLI